MKEAPNISDRAPWLEAAETQAVFKALGAQGHIARAVGGSVRNTLLGRPVGDVDLASDAEPETVMELAKAAGLKAVATGLDHGTVTVISGHRPFEVTTLRTDVETFGRHANVSFTDDWEADARRRDFTINALYADADGTLYDPLDGLTDIEAHRVRFIGDPDARIAEDYLRILRFFRFVAELDSPELDRDGLAACVRQHGGLDQLSAERVHSELARLLVADAALRALAAMYDHGLLVALLGSVCHLPRLERLIAIEEQVGGERNAMARLAALALMTGEDAERLTARFKLSGAERSMLVNAGKYREIDAGLDESDARRQLYRLGGDAWRHAVLQAWASDGALPQSQTWRALFDLPDRWEIPEFPLQGADILALGLEAGPRVGEVLKTLETQWMDDDFRKDRDDLLEMAKVLVEQESPS
jgi:poly(A) polymerase